MTRRRRSRKTVWTSTCCDGRTAGESGTRCPRASTTPSSTIPCSCLRTSRANSAWCNGNTAQVSLLCAHFLSLSLSHIHGQRTYQRKTDVTVIICFPVLLFCVDWLIDGFERCNSGLNKLVPGFMICILNWCDIISSISNMWFSQRWPWGSWDVKTQELSNTSSI